MSRERSLVGLDLTTKADLATLASTSRLQVSPENSRLKRPRGAELFAPADLLAGDSLFEKTFPSERKTRMDNEDWEVPKRHKMDHVATPLHDVAGMQAQMPGTSSDSLSQAGTSNTFNMNATPPDSPSASPVTASNYFQAIDSYENYSQHNTEVAFNQMQGYPLSNSRIRFSEGDDSLQDSYYDLDDIGNRSPLPETVTVDYGPHLSPPPSVPASSPSPSPSSGESDIDLASEAGIERKEKPTEVDVTGKGTTMFVTYTISEDRTGDQEGIMMQRLAALGSRCRTIPDGH
jgi:hypothetical protein